MQKARVRELIVNISLIVLIGIIFKTFLIDEKSKAAFVSYKFVLYAFVCFWVMPIFCVWLGIKKSLVDSLSKILSNMFRAMIVLNTIICVWEDKSTYYRVVLNLFVIFVCLLNVGIHIYTETKPRCGGVTKSERKNIENSLNILQGCHLLLQDEQRLHLLVLMNDLESCIEGKISIVHGIDINIFQECMEIQNGVLTNDENKVNLHIELVMQFVHLAEQLEKQKVRKETSYEFI